MVTGDLVRWSWSGLLKGTKRRVTSAKWPCRYPYKDSEFIIQVISEQPDAAKDEGENKLGADPNASTAGAAEEEEKAEEKIETLEIQELTKTEAGLGITVAFRKPPPIHMVKYPSTKESTRLTRLLLHSLDVHL